VEGQSSATKTEASDDYVYIPPDLAVEMKAWLECSDGESTDWLFQTEHGWRGFLNANNYRNRILKPAAIRAGVGMIDTGKKDEKGKPILKTDIDFRAANLRHTVWRSRQGSEEHSGATQTCRSGNHAEALPKGRPGQCEGSRDCTGK
jgi:hypothetical protein